MKQKILYLGGFKIGYINYMPENFIHFENIDISLMDYDVVILNPLSFYNTYICNNKNINNNLLLNINENKEILQNISNKWKEKINLFTHKNNSVFIFLPRYSRNKIIDYMNTYYITKSLLTFENLEYESGNLVYKKTSSILDNLFYRFKDNFTYNLTYTDVKCSNIESKTNNILCGKDKYKILGSIIEVENGGRFFILPEINFNSQQDLIDLINIILEIDNKSRYNKEKTLAPEWANNEIYLTKKSKNIISKINDNNEKIDELKNNNIILNEELEKEEAIKDLLFENGKSLENIIIETLNILDYKAENIIINDTEIDILATSPENDIFCCEVEGKDNSAIDVTYLIT